MPGQTGPKRSKHQLEKDRHMTMNLYMQRHTIYEIAALLDVSPTTISNDIRAVLAQWREDTRIDLDQARKEEIERLNHLEQVHWKAWEKNNKPIHLDGVGKCIAQRIKLLGLEPAEVPQVIATETVTTIHERGLDGSQQLLAEVNQRSLTMLQELNDKHKEAGIGHYRTRPVLVEGEVIEEF